MTKIKFFTFTDLIQGEAEINAWLKKRSKYDQIMSVKTIAADAEHERFLVEIVYVEQDEISGVI